MDVDTVMDMDRKYNEKKDVRILIVDDVEVNLTILGGIIEDMGYQPLLAAGVTEALEQLQDSARLPQLILSDISMPEIDGFTFCSILKKDLYTKDIPVIFISAMDTASDLSRGFALGAVDYISKPIDETEVRMRVSTHLKLYFMQKDLEENNRHLNVVAARHMEKLHAEQKNAITAFTRLAEKKQNSVAARYEYRLHNSRILAEGMQLSPEFEDAVTDGFIDTIESSAGMCNIGKLMLPDAVLQKNAPLTDGERALLRTHTELGAKTLLDIYQGIGQNEFVAMAVDIAWCHHENWDGSGYPRGLKGGEIPLCARIVRIVNAFDGMAGKHGKEHTFSIKDAVNEVRANAGIWFDPDIVKVFMKIYHNFHGLNLFAN